MISALSTRTFIQLLNSLQGVLDGRLVVWRVQVEQVDAVGVGGVNRDRECVCMCV